MEQHITICHEEEKFLPTIWWKSIFQWQNRTNRLLCSMLPTSIKNAEGEVFGKFQDEIQKSFVEMFNTRQMYMPLLTGNHAEPYIDILEDTHGFTIRADVPGIDAKFLHVIARNGALVINGKRKDSIRNHKTHTLHNECCHGSFERIIAVPDEADLKKADASCDLNVLTIEIPKKIGKTQDGKKRAGANDYEASYGPDLARL